MEITDELKPNGITQLYQLDKFISVLICTRRNKQTTFLDKHSGEIRLNGLLPDALCTTLLILRLSFAVPINV